MADKTEEVVVEKSGGGKSLLIIIMAAIIVVLAILAGLIIFLMSGNDEAAAQAGAMQPQAQTQQAPMQPAHQPGKRSSDFMNMGPIYPLDQFIVNLLSENGSRFLKTKIDMEQSDEKLTPELDKKKALIRDIVIRTLSAKTYEEVSTAKGKDRLKDEIVGKINEVLSDGYVKNIYFTDFVVQ